MTIQKAIGILEYHNKWRRSNEDMEMVDPKELGRAIDKVVEYHKKNHLLLK